MTDEAVLTPPDVRVVRDELWRLVSADLLGPLDGEHEEFPREDPLDRYPLGRLAPRGVEVEPDTRDDLAGADTGEATEGDQEPVAPNMPSPALSSVGFTATVSGAVAELRVTARWARYERVTATAEPGRGQLAVPGGAVVRRRGRGRGVPAAPRAGRRR